MALYIVTTHLNGHTEKAWPSYQTIADATGKSVKTIQRAISELETSGWFEVRRGNGSGQNTEYRPSATSILRASDAREKTDKVVTLYPSEGGKNVRQGGQMCPAKGGRYVHQTQRKKKYINLTRARMPSRASRRGELLHSFLSKKRNQNRSSNGSLGYAIIAFLRLKL